MATASKQTEKVIFWRWPSEKWNENSLWNLLTELWKKSGKQEMVQQGHCELNNGCKLKGWVNDILYRVWAGKWSLEFLNLVFIFNSIKLILITYIVNTDNEARVRQNSRFSYLEFFSCKTDFNLYDWFKFIAKIFKKVSIQIFDVWIMQSKLWMMDNVRSHWLLSWPKTVMNSLLSGHFQNTVYNEEWVRIWSYFDLHDWVRGRGIVTIPLVVPVWYLLRYSTSNIIA